METKILFSSFLLLLLAFSASAQMPGNLLDIPSLHSYRIFVYICIYIRMSDLRFLYIRMSDLRFYLPSYCFLACLVGEVQRYPFFFSSLLCNFHYGSRQFFLDFLLSARGGGHMNWKDFFLSFICNRELQCFLFSPSFNYW